MSKLTETRYEWKDDVGSGSTLKDQTLIQRILCVKDFGNFEK